MELIYVQTSLKSQGNPELAILENERRMTICAIIQIAGLDTYNCFRERSWS